MKKGMRERVSGDDVCDCCFGEQLDNKKPFRPLNIFKHMLKNNFVLFSYHFFFDCYHYSNIRHTLFQNFNWLPNYCALDLTLLTCGNPTLPYEQNEIIFMHVFEYIKRSERFLVV
jgi:hypothetical protein